VALEDGHLQVSPLTLTYAEGSISGNATIDATTDKPEVIVKVTAEDVNIGSLLAHAHQPLIAKGMLTFVVDIKGTGASPHQLASTLNGEVAVAVENGKTKRALDLIAPDATDLVTGMRSMKDYIDLNCFLMRFIFADGVGTSQMLRADTALTEVEGAGRIDFTTKPETIELVLNPKKKKRRFGLSSPAHIRGPLCNPSVRKIPAKEAANLAAEITLPMVFLPVRGLGYLHYMMRKDKEGTPCVFEQN
jgi:uncharacterized protein involved in outer membrane biogenesis